MTTEDQIQLLRQMPVFGGLKSEALHLILEQSQTIHVADGDYFFHEGEPGDALFVLESGDVQIEKDWNGAAVYLGNLGPGDCIGEMALIDLEARSASVKATSDCQAIAISRKALNSLFQLDLEQYAIIMMNMGREVSRRLRLADQRLFVHRQKARQSGQELEDDLDE